MAEKELSPRDAEKADEEEQTNADVTYEVIRRQGEQEMKRATSALAWSGLAAGLSLGFSLVTQAVLRSHLPEAEWTPLVTKLGYAVGFLIVILGSQQLFTENTLTIVVPALSRRSIRTVRDVMRVWGVVLATNLIGAHLFALVLARTTTFGPKMHEAFGAIGRSAIDGTFGTVFLQAIAAGCLIALMVWMVPAAKEAKFWVIVVMTWLVGAAGLAHVIAGSTDVLYLVFNGELPYPTYLGRFLLPALLGNVIGGVTLVACLNHAQVVAGGAAPGE